MSMNLTEALKTIQNECKSHDDCGECPLYLSDHGCMMNNGEYAEPSHWKLNETPWKAFLP